MNGGKYGAPWAFPPVPDSKPPAVKNASWVRNRIDQYVLARLQAAIAKVKRARTRSMPRYRGCAMPPTVLVQPKGSSIFFRRRCDRA